MIPDSAVQMIRHLFSTIPAVLRIVAAVSLLLYKLDKLMPKIREDNEMHHAAMQKETSVVEHE
ncbi:MAG: MFS transporter [Eubacterium sp.]|nr:MFS transporter [Eubacterium sp.]